MLFLLSVKVEGRIFARKLGKQVEVMRHLKIDLIHC